MSFTINDLPSSKPVGLCENVRVHPGKLVKRWRTERDLSLAKLSAKAGVDKMALSDIENGKSDPRVSTLQKIAVALDVPVTYLLSESDERPSLSLVVGSIASQESADAIAKIEEFKNTLVRMDAFLEPALAEIEQAMRDLDALKALCKKHG